MFNPTLQSSFGINQPTGGQPSLIGTIGGLFSDFVSMESKLQPEQPKLTEDEKFSVALQDFFESKPPGTEWNRNTAREFIWKNPQFEPQTVSFSKSLGVMMDDPVEMGVQKGFEKYADDPEFTMAVAHASNLPLAEQEPYMLNWVYLKAQQEAELNNLTREKTKLEAEGVFETRAWEVLAPTQKAFADNVVSQSVEPAVLSITQGVPYKLDPKIVADYGLNYDTVTIENFPMFLADVRKHLGNYMMSDYANKHNGIASKILPPTAHEERVFERLLPYEEAFKGIASPKEREAMLKSIAGNKALEKLDKAGVLVGIEILRTLPPELLNNPSVTKALWGETGSAAGFAEAVGAVIGSSYKNAKDNMDKASTTEADKVAKAGMQLLNAGVPSFDAFAITTSALKRSGYGVLDGPTFNTFMSKSVNWMKTKAAEDPEAKMYMQEWFVSDINMTVSTIKRELGPGVELMYQNGRFTVIPTLEGMGVDQAGSVDIVKDSQRNLAAGLTVDDLNKKLASVKLLGPMGQEVIDVIVGGQLGPDAVKGGAGNTAVEGSAGNDTLQDSIGAKLGINFADYEAKYGLPSGFLEKTAYIESRGNPKAKNPNSSAGGLFQQIDSNAKEWGVKDRFDPVQSTEGAAKFAASNAKYLRGILGREPTGGELYLAHQQGPGGAAKLLSNPNALAVDIVGEKAVKLNGGNVNMTAGEFANIWISKFNGQRAPTTAQQATGGTTGFAEGRISATEAPTGQVASGAPEVPESSSGAVVAPLASPELEDKAVELLDRQVLSEKAKEIIKNKPMDPEVKALIEALIGGAK